MYFKILVQLVYKLADTFVQWFHKFFVTCMAGNEDALDLEFAIESLAIRGKQMPHQIVFYSGQSGKSKGARSTL